MFTTNVVGDVGTSTHCSRRVLTCRRGAGRGVEGWPAPGSSSVASHRPDGPVEGEKLERPLSKVIDEVIGHAVAATLGSAAAPRRGQVGSRGTSVMADRVENTEPPSTLPSSRISRERA
jgi:hypothetical protein